MFKKPVRTLKITLSDAGEPDLWIEVEHPEVLSWRTKRRIIAAQGIEDEATRSVRQVAAMLVSWNLTRDDGTAIPTPPSDDDLDALPSHVVEGILLAVGALFEIPKASGSESGTG